MDLNHFQIYKNTSLQLFCQIDFRIAQNETNSIINKTPKKTEKTTSHSPTTINRFPLKQQTHIKIGRKSQRVLLHAFNGACAGIKPIVLVDFVGVVQYV